MRDYLARWNGVPVTISQLPTRGGVTLLNKMERVVKPGTGLNPGVTRKAYMERLRLELFIRETGLRD